ncbi:MAG: hypothetical protein PWQ97_5 [Tepidanaerobacteraceae bacterium]|nr:hypothetical protein [Tepidanaerobacteraceae bacterium]
MQLDAKIILISMLAVLGSMGLYYGISSAFLKKIEICPETVIIVKNAQDKIEGIVRSFYGHYHNNGEKELWVVDGGSSDETAAILERLSFEFTGLKSLLLPDLSAKACMQEVLKYIDGPLILIIDLTDRTKNKSDIFF